MTTQTITFGILNDYQAGDPDGSIDRASYDALARRGFSRDKDFYALVDSGGDSRWDQAFELSDVGRHGALSSLKSEDTISDPVRITATGRVGAGVGDLTGSVFYDARFGFSIADQSHHRGDADGWHALNRGEAIDFAVDAVNGEARRLQKASFTVMTEDRNDHATVHLDFDKATLARSGDASQTSSAFALTNLSRNDLVEVDFEHHTIMVNHVAVADVPDSFWAAYEAAGRQNLTIGSGANDREGFSLANVQLTTDVTDFAPVLEPAAPAALTETVGTPVAGATLATAGSIAFSDQDLFDTHTVSAAFNTSASTLASSLGTFTPALSHDTTGTGAGGAIGWNYVVDAAKVEYLAEGQTVTEVYTVSVNDGHGGIATRDVTITIAGTNDNPVITSSAQTGSVSEGDPAHGSNMTATGTVTSSDVDVGDTHTFSVSSAAAHGAASVDGSGNWTYTVSDTDAVDALAVGEHLADNFTVKVADNHGGFATQVANIDIVGTNDAPVAHTDNLISVGSGDTLTAVSTDGSTNLARVVDATNPIVGTWLVSGVGAANNTIAITFLADGTYMLAEDGNHAADPSGQNGMERGTYSWNSSTGAFTFVTTVDTNGQWGLSHSDVFNMHVNGDTLTAVSTDGSTSLARVVDATNPIVGTWLVSGVGAANNTIAITFLADGTYMLAEDGTDPSSQGMERGTYSWNSSTGAFTYVTTVDTNGQWGLSHSDVYNVHISLTNEDTPVQISAATLLANDTDVDHGDVLSVATVSAHSALGAAVTLSGGSIGYDPTGAASLQALAEGQKATDSFTYTVSDGHGGFSTASVSFEVAGVNDAPIAVADTNAFDPVVEAGIFSGAGSNPVNGLAGTWLGTGAEFTALSLFADGRYMYMEGAGPAPNGGEAGRWAYDASAGKIALFPFFDGNIGGGLAPDQNGIFNLVSVNGDDLSLTLHNGAGTLTLEAARQHTSTGITGTWLSPATGSEPFTALILFDDNRFMYMEGAGPLPNGLEAGTYSYNPSTGALQFYTTFDGNNDSSGHGGISPSLDGQTLSAVITGDTLNVSIGNTHLTPLFRQFSSPSSNFVGDAAASGNVLANDSDVDATDTLIVVGVAAGTSAGPLSGHVGDTIAGTYGTVKVGADGAWTYTLNNGNPNTNALAQGESASDVFTYTVSDGHGGTGTATLMVDITGTNDAPVITSGAQSGAVQEDGSAVASGHVTATDADHGDHQHYSGDAAGTYGSFTVNPVTGEWTYLLANGGPNVQALAAGETHDETFTVQVTDDHGASRTQAVTIHVTGSNDVPVIDGIHSGSVTEDTNVDASGNLVATGALTISDADANQSAFQVQTNSAGQYGTFSIDAGGHWSYTANNGQAAIQALGANDHLTETFAVNSLDGTASQNVEITIAGADEAPAGIGRPLVVAYDDQNGNNIYDAAGDTLYFGVFDTNGDHAVSAGDTLRADFYPADVSVSALYEFQNKDHVITAVDGSPGENVLFAVAGNELVVFASTAYEEGVLNSTYDNWLHGGPELMLTDDLPPGGVTWTSVVSIADGWAAASTLGPMGPGTATTSLVTQLENQHWLNVDFLIAPPTP